MPRGRPVKSQIRQNIIEILFYLKQGYGYNIAKVYNDIFPQVFLDYEPRNFVIYTQKRDWR